MPETALSPLVSELETVEQEARCNERPPTRGGASLADPRPAAPHDGVMAETDALIDRIEAGIRGR